MKASVLTAIETARHELVGSLRQRYAPSGQSPDAAHPTAVCMITSRCCVQISVPYRSSTSSQEPERPETCFCVAHNRYQPVFYFHFSLLSRDVDWDIRNPEQCVLQYPQVITRTLSGLWAIVISEGTDTP